ncbi:conserved hypothetical protein [Culex quinquefasciatus]|uniref:Uncharacterized protein n=1 Tax=Culex quinquefasciatus TaxID=7176 RepID=B0WA42_CULQU|nr:conserved hypothetical protein [Culex quinquefasciatus]|eukprot:XP_001845576.1 conserved hypothetical protein [Culex quinquefasciatus]
MPCNSKEKINKNKTHSMGFDSAHLPKVRRVVSRLVCHVSFSGIRTARNNGQRCINFAASRGMVVRSTFFPRKDIHKATWVSPNGRTKNQIDHVLIDGRFFSYITNVRTYRGANIDSDHYLVGACMRSKLSTVCYQRRSPPTPPLNVERLQDSEVADSYAQQL